MGESAHEMKAPASASQQQATASAEQTEHEEIQAKLNVVSSNFLWLRNEAGDEIETVRAQLKSKDVPSWHEALIEGIVETALTAVGARSGAIAAERLLHKAKEELPGEFVKKLFEEGLPAGVTASREMIHGRHGDGVDGFVDIYKRGVTKLHHENHVQFDLHQRQNVKTLEQANELFAACSEDNLLRAAQAHGDQCRDAWVTFVEESAFGSMATQAMRDEVNARAPGFMPAQAPSLAAAAVGAAPGVLEIGATLPEINNNRMSGTPKVELALLNDINEATRREYEGHPLADMNIPRQVRCTVEGDMPSFTVNINERGNQVGWLRHSQNEWLRARAMVGRPSSEAHEDPGLADQGLKMLLSELIPATIEKKLL